MSKAVLVFDEMPVNCSHCTCYQARNTECYAAGKKIESNEALFGNRPKWCPLKKIPEKKPDYDMILF